MSKPNNNGDVVAGLTAGGVAVTSISACVFILQMPIAVSLLPAVLLGAGVMLLFPGTSLAERTTPNEKEEAAITAARLKIRSLQSCAAKIPAQRTVAIGLVRDIAAEASRILVAIESDSNKFQAAEPFLNQYLVPIDSWLSRYLLLVDRDIESAKDFIAAAERNALPDIKSQLTNLYENLHVNDVAEFLAGSMGGLAFPNIELKNEQ